MSGLPMISMAWAVAFVAVMSVPAMGSFQMSTGFYTTCAVSDGYAKCWGDNRHGQLGLGNKYPSTVSEPEENPIDFGTDFMVDSMECGGYFCCALSTARSVKCVGRCQYIGCFNDDAYGDNLGDYAGEVGDGIPTVPALDGAEHIVALWYMVCVLGRNGDGVQHFIGCVGAEDIMASSPIWGADWTVDGDTAHVDLSWTPNGLGGGWYTLCVFDSNTEGALECYGQVAVDEDVTGSLYIESVQCGDYHCCAKSGSSLVCWANYENRGSWFDYGQDDTAQLGDNVQDYSVARYSTCALTTDGEVKCFGDNDYGQLGNSPFDVPDHFSLDGVHLAHGGNARAHHCIYDDAAEPKARCWGLGTYGQLGDGSTSNQYLPEYLEEDITLQFPDGTGCDADSFLEHCDPETNCMLGNDRMSGSCCTAEFPCLEGEGDCDSDNDCSGALVCGRNNCGSPFQDTHDCCTRVAEGPTGCDKASFESQCPLKENCFLDSIGRWSGSCCTSEFQCLEGEGDCDSDSDCAGPLVCGTNNCADVFQDTHDCCEWDATASASIAVSVGAAVVAEDGSGADEANPDDNTTVIWMEAVFGAVIAAVLISAAVLLVLFMAKRRKSAGKKAVTEMCDAVHVPELSPTDCVKVDAVDVVTAKDTGDGVVAEEAATADAGNTESV